MPSVSKRYALAFLIFLVVTTICGPFHEHASAIPGLRDGCSVVPAHMAKVRRHTALSAPNDPCFFSGHDTCLL